MFLQGREPIFHSQITSNCYQWPLRTGHLMSTFPTLVNLPVSSTQDMQLSPAFRAQQLLLAWIKPDKTWHQGEKMPLESEIPLLLQAHMEVFWDHFIYRTDANIFKIYIFYAYFCPFVVVLFKWPHSYLHLRSRWIKMVKENIAMYFCCSCCLFIVKMTVRNLFCCHRTVEECMEWTSVFHPSLW